MKKLFITLSLLLSLSLASCTSNQRVKTFGGTAELKLEKGQKLVNVTWKETNLWILTKSMKPTDSAETYKFHEDSNLGIVQGTYIITEIK